MNREEIDEIDELEIDFNNIDELNLALEVSSKKAIYLLNEFSNEIINLQQENKKLNERIYKAIEYIKNNHLYGYEIDEEEIFEYVTDEKSKYGLLEILGDNNE